MKFKIEKILNYKGDNPYINRIKHKYSQNIKNTSKTLDISRFKEIIVNTYSIEFILVNGYNEFKSLNPKLKQINKELKENKKLPRHCSFVFDSNIPKGSFMPIRKNIDVPITEFENEYLMRNFRYSGYSFHTPVSIDLNENNKNLIRKQFSLPESRFLADVKIDKLLGETLKFYHVSYKGKSFFLHKEDTENPVYKMWDSYPLDVDRLNSIDVSPEWVNNGYKYKDHQILSVKAGLTEKRFLIADKTGIGKSKQGLGILMMGNVKRGIIVTFNDDKPKWAKLIEDHGKTSQIVASTISKTKFNYEADYYVINYEGLSKYMKKRDDFSLLDYEFDGILFDECQKIKTLESSQTKMAKILAHRDGVEYCIGLSATPFEDNYQVFSIIDTLGLNKNMAKCYHYEDNIRTHQITYCAAFPMLKKGRMVLFNGQKGEDGIYRIFSNTTELAQRIKYNFLSRSSDEIKGFPKKKEHVIQIELDNMAKKEYEAYKKELIDHYREIAEKHKKSGQELLEFNPELPVSIKLRQFLAEYNVKNTVNLAKKLIKEGKKIIIFTHFEKELNMICERLIGKIVWVNTAKTKRWRRLKENYDVIQEFKNNPDIKVIAGNIKTLGAGHNIKEADVQILNSPDWCYAEHEQAMGRAWRLDREGLVEGYFFNYPDTEVATVFLKAHSKKENMEHLLNLDKYLLKKENEES